MPALPWVYFVGRSITAMCDWLQGMRTTSLYILSVACYHGANGMFHPDCIGNLAFLQGGFLNRDLLPSLPMRLLVPIVKLVGMPLGADRTPHRVPCPSLLTPPPTHTHMHA